VIVKEAVANGRLAGAAAPTALQAVAAEAGAGADAIAIAVALAQPWADVVLSGASSAAMLASNLSALEVEVDVALQDRLAGLGEPVEDYWAARAELPWT
jgi:aryl-alcohol dehydrogenase-like predicted oxidoreductase